MSNELTEFKYIQRNIDCLKSLYDTEVIFLIYNSLYQQAVKNDLIRYVPNNKLIKEKYEKLFLKLKNELKDKLNLNLYDINNVDQSNEIYDGIIEII